jgi:hypothetical protein
MQLIFAMGVGYACSPPLPHASYTARTHQLWYVLWTYIMRDHWELTLTDPQLLGQWLVINPCWVCHGTSPHNCLYNLGGG